MPRVTPSLIVGLIDSSHPNAHRPQNIGSLDEGYLQSVATLIALLDELDENTVGALSSDQYRDLLVSIEMVRAAAIRWQSPQTAGGPRTVISQRQELGGRNPIQVIRTIMAACPEEPVAVAQARLAFIADPALEESIATDIASAEAAMTDGRFKNACVMAGSAIEALLLWAVQRKTTAQQQAAIVAANARRGASGQPPIHPHADPLRWGLEEYIEVARELGAIPAATAASCLLAKDFRNLIHPGRAQRLAQKATRGTAAQGLAAMSLTVESLAAALAAGTI